MAGSWEKKMMASLAGAGKRMGIKRGRSGKGEPRRPKKKQLAVQRVGATGMSANPLFSLEQMAENASGFCAGRKQKGMASAIPSQLGRLALRDAAA
ncbi:hypothetical protein B0T49_03925 [Chromobacterium violaceum]|uniref:Uncharacterized protein n=1 Tax=Chromobacterium violaceum TaxID=536 RepID=A0A202BCF5_CHRVL|nr:hypothetical protein CRN81_16460 [Chromobacterium violaceum]ATP33744.1 hypothetical protein CR207_16480 [Chromobacterium violaceum]KJH68565.1 hypothetical protein UF16_04710 [Chromobacterium violaceum]OQS11864.1 hypothetical protein B0T38_04045 [Chromobacterium violaceum]OQS29000.1 hypothetical protein B0T37_03245 [Chromobacterium violaceum]